MQNRKLFSFFSGRSIAFIIAFSFLLAIIGCQSKTQVKKLTRLNEKTGKLEKPTNKKTETDMVKGSMYHLPLTIVKAAVPMKLKKETPGEFSEFIPCVFDPDELDEVPDDRIKIEKKELSIDPPTFSSVGTADLDETFVVQTTGSYFESRTVAMTFNKEGVLTEGSAESKDEALPMAIKTAQIIIGLGMKAATVAGGSPLIGASPDKIKEDLKGDIENAEVLKVVPRAERQCYLQGYDDELGRIRKRLKESYDELNDARAQKLPEEEIKAVEKRIIALQQEESAWSTKRKTARKNWDRMRSSSAADLAYDSLNVQWDKAEKAKRMLDKFTNERVQLQASLADLDPEIYKSRLKELDDKIKPLTESFFGKKETFAWTGNFELKPAKSKSQNFKTLFTYSKANGICYNAGFYDDLKLNGILIPKEFQFNKCDAANPEQKLAKLQIYADRENDDAKFIEAVTLARQNELQSNKNSSSGWYFRIPAKAKIALIECPGGDYLNRCAAASFNEYGRDKMMIAQYGAVVSLPAKTAGRSSSTSVSLDEATGALKNFKVSSSPLIDKSTLDDANKTAEKALDTADPLTKKKRELDLIKTQNEINEQRKKLEESNKSDESTDKP